MGWDRDAETLGLVTSNWYCLFRSALLLCLLLILFCLYLEFLVVNFFLVSSRSCDLCSQVWFVGILDRVIVSCWTLLFFLLVFVQSCDDKEGKAWGFCGVWSALSFFLLSFFAAWFFFYLRQTFSIAPRALLPEAGTLGCTGSNVECMSFLCLSLLLASLCPPSPFALCPFQAVQEHNPSLWCRLAEQGTWCVIMLVVVCIKAVVRYCVSTEESPRPLPPSPSPSLCLPHRRRKLTVFVLPAPPKYPLLQRDVIFVTPPTSFVLSS